MKHIFFAFALLALTGVALAFQQAAPKAAMTDAQVIAHQLPSYPLTTCPISTDVLGGDMGEPVNFVHEGRLVRFCCKSCVKEFKADPASTLKMIDAAVIKAQMASYPMKTCPVSGKELSDTAFNHVEGTRLVRFCCPKCPETFAATPAKYMAQVDKALIESQKKSYALTTCPVSGKAIAGDAIDYLHGTRLVRFCCEKCPTAFAAEPAKYLPKLDGTKKPANASSPADKKGD